MAPQRSKVKPPRRSGHHTPGPADLHEGVDATLHLGRLVRRAQLHADARLALRHHWEAEADDVDAPFQHLVGNLAGEASVAEHDRHDGAGVVTPDVKACLFHASSELAHVGLQLLDQVGVRTQHPKDFQRSAGDGGCQGVREQIGAGLVPQHVDEDLGAGGVAAGGAAESLAQSAVDNVHLPAHSAQLRRAPPSSPQETCGVALVYEDLGVILLGYGADLLQRGDVAVHGEDAVRDDHLVPDTLLDALLEDSLEVRHVEVVVAVTLSLAETDAIDDGGMVQGVGDHSILRPEACLKEPGVGIEARWEENGVLCAMELADRSFQLLVDVLRAADEANRGKAEAMAAERILGGLHQGRVA
mmetsp:Transcript_65596/g.140220  ORF Transcript_65596/g.140220 Transcript_65596/m.140220 type:complete len:358 (+) Transcript_65596:63-1136(+)